MRLVRARSTVGPAMLLVLCGAVTACDDDPGGAATPTQPSSPSTTASSDGSSSATASQTTASSSGTPGVAPATGPELVVKTASAHAPDGWRSAGSLIGTDQAALQPSTFNSLSLDDHVNLSGGSSSELDAMYDAFVAVSPDVKDLTRLPDVSLAGTPALHVRYRTEDRAVVSDMITTVRDKRSVTLFFSLEPKTLREQPELIDSVVASFAWR